MNNLYGVVTIGPDVEVTENYELGFGNKYSSIHIFPDGRIIAKVQKGSENERSIRLDEILSYIVEEMESLQSINSKKRKRETIVQ